MNVAYLDSIPTRERLQRLGQIGGLGHVRPIDQNGNDPDIPGQRRRDFDPHKIIRVVEAAPRFIFCIEPMRAHYGQEHVTRRDLRMQVGYEIDPGRNVVDIHKEILATKRHRQAIV